MKELTTDGVYTITDDMKAKLAEFYGGYATEAETAATIKRYMSQMIISSIHIQQLRLQYMKSMWQRQEIRHLQSSRQQQAHTSSQEAL